MKYDDIQIGDIVEINSSGYFSGHLKKPDYKYKVYAKPPHTGMVQVIPVHISTDGILGFTNIKYAVPSELSLYEKANTPAIQHAQSDTRQQSAGQEI